ncbi:MAG: hypothetical protein JSR92_16310 [Proteobacteria bacterium]|nr:hypothetical protein [Pseudomonadota bacterium]
MTTLVARVQLEFVRDLVALFERDDNMMQPVAVYQSQYIAIIALLRSVGHVFEKVDCVEAVRRAWCRQRWKVWNQNPVFSQFIEPTRNDLLKEFAGGLELNCDAIGVAAIVADPSMPRGACQVVSFDPRKFRDRNGRSVLQQLHAAIAFWNECLAEAERQFGNDLHDRSGQPRS